MTKNYKITFNEMENNKFNLIENEDIRKNCMSIYSYLLKLNTKKNDQYLIAGVEHLKCFSKLNISYRIFLQQYIRNHTKISVKTLKNRIDKLVELGLLITEKVKNSFEYSFHRFTVNEKVNEIGNNSKPIETVDNTVIAGSGDLPKYQNPKGVIDLDTNNCSTIVDNFDYANFIEGQQKCDSWDFVSDTLLTAFKTLKVRSNWIKGQVIDRVFKTYPNVTKKYCMAYICTTIENARNTFYSNYNVYVRGNKNSSNTNNSDSTFNFEGRDYSKEDLQNMEKGLLGY